MAVTTREELKQYALRKLGKPVININVDDTQLEDRIDEALETYQEKHFDATEMDWVFYELTQNDIDNGFIPIPADIMTVISVMPFNELFAQGDIFGYQYQLAISTLSPWKPFNQIDYFMNIANYESISEMTSVNPSIQFTRHADRLKIFSNISRLNIGYKIGIQVQRIIDPESNNKIYNDKWLKEYVTALFKKQWGENMKKFSGVTMLGGVELNGQQLFDEANLEIESLIETLQETYMEPCGFIMG